MCDFKPGDEVVCVDASACAATGQPSGLTVDAVYAVTALTKRGGIRVAEVVAPATARWGRDWGFLARRFRKAHKRRDDLSIEAFLTIKPGFEEPRRTNQPVKRKERV